MFLDAFVASSDNVGVAMTAAPAQSVAEISDTQVGSVVLPTGTTGLMYKLKKNWSYLVVVALAGYHYYCSTKKKTSTNYRRR